VPAASARRSDETEVANQLLVLQHGGGADLAKSTAAAAQPPPPPRIPSRLTRYKCVYGVV